jgi:protein-disulfide isomerase
MRACIGGRLAIIAALLLCAVGLVHPGTAHGQPATGRPAPATTDSTAYFVPVEGSPARGPAAAAVTLVVFSDFQCPFCGKLATTLEQLGAKYGPALRIVYKSNPLPFHPRAEPAAELGLEAFARQGDAGFWRAHDRLFAQQNKLDDAALAQLAADLGLDPQGAMAAVQSRKHAAQIEADQALAEDLDATGTPTSYINGRKLTGSQPFDTFAQLIDEEIDHASRLSAKGVPLNRLYAEMQKTAQRGGPTKIKLPPPTAAQPSRGPRNAPVTIRIFSDFECPYCARVRPTLEQIRRDFPEDVRLVWHNTPLGMHPNARPAAMAAIEAFQQKGNDGFWKMHDLLFDNQRDLGRAKLRSLAAEIGLDLARFDAALDREKHATAIAADASLAERAKITGTPTFVVNGYLLTGAQSYAKFARLIRRSLADAGSKR